MFAAFDAQSVTPEDLEFFPDCLVCLEAGQPGSQGSLAEALSSGVPLKIVVHVADLLEESGLGHGQFAFGMRATQLASAAMTCDDVFVLQSTASNLLQLRSRIERGLRYAGPALFSIYAAPDGGSLPGYLLAAAATQGRAFPAFSYDPGAGPDLAARFSLENNPQPEFDWPVERLDYADQDLQAVSEEVAFTFADFALCDPRHAGHLRPPRVRPGARACYSAGMDGTAARRSDRRRSLRAGGGRRPALPPRRGRTPDARGAALPRSVAPAAGTGRHPRFACRAPARERAPGLGGGAPARGGRARRRPQWKVLL